MNATEFYEDVVTWVQDRWGTYGVWADEKAGVFAEDFAHVPVGVAQEALMVLYNEGGARPPTPAALRKECRRVAKERGVDISGYQGDPCAAGHAWAIVEDDGIYRDLYCARCKEEKRVPRHEVPTKGEYQEGAFGPLTGRQAYKGNPDPYV